VFIALRLDGLASSPYEALAQRQWTAQHGLLGALHGHGGRAYDICTVAVRVTPTCPSGR